MSEQIDQPAELSLDLPHVEPAQPSAIGTEDGHSMVAASRKGSRHKQLVSAVATTQLDETYAPMQLDAFRTSGDAPPAATVEFDTRPSAIPGVVLVDPAAIEPEPFNGRGLAAFNPDHNRELIQDIRIRGNTVPVRLRPRANGQGWTCASGSRRVNAARVIAAEQPGFRVAAIIDTNMTDADAYALCLADNRGRNEVTALQQGREIQWALANLFGGSRQAYIDAHGTDKSVVSRALDLVNLPETLLAAAEDRETLPTRFAEKLAPKLKAGAERKVINARLKALGPDRLPGPQLMAYLLTGERERPVPDRRIVRFGSGRNLVRASVTVAQDRSAVFKLPNISSLADEQKQQLRAFLSEQIDELLGALADIRT